MKVLSRVVLILTGTLAALIAYFALSKAGQEAALSDPDNLGNIIAFFALTMPMMALRPYRLWWFLPIVVMFGGALQLTKPYVGAVQEIQDWSADLLGILLGTVCGLLIHEIIVRCIKWRTLFDANLISYATHTTGLVPSGQSVAFDLVPLIRAVDCSPFIAGEGAHIGLDDRLAAPRLQSGESDPYLSLHSSLSGGPHTRLRWQGHAQGMLRSWLCSFFDHLIKKPAKVGRG